MLLRRLALLLFVYVSAEFSNPFMPGAVTFEGGSMETAKAERHRPAAPVPLRPALIDRVPSVVRRVPAPPARISAAPRRPIPIAHHVVPSLDPISPEDH